MIEGKQVKSEEKRAPAVPTSQEGYDRRIISKSGGGRGTSALKAK